MPAASRIVRRRIDSTRRKNILKKKIYYKLVPSALGAIK